MRVAILLSGQPRFLSRNNLESLNKWFLSKYDCDVYCHFWWNPEGGVFETSPWNHIGGVKISSNIDKIIEDLYNPKVSKWDLPPKEEEFMRNYKNTSNPRTNYNLPSLYFSMLKSYQLLEYACLNEGLHYDWVVKLRYDEFINSAPDLDSLDSDTFYSPDFGHKMIPAGQIMIIPYNRAKEVLDIYNHMDEVYNKCKFFNDEQMMTCYLKSLGIKIVNTKSISITTIRR